MFLVNLNPTDKSKTKIVNISTDKYGFRNAIDFKDSDFILTELMIII